MGDPNDDLVSFVLCWRLLHLAGLGLYTWMLTSKDVSYVLAFGVDKDLIDTTQHKFAIIILS